METMSAEKPQAGKGYGLKFDNAPDLSVTADEAGLIASWSEQAESAFGWNEKEVVGLPLAHIFLPLASQGSTVSEMESPVKAARPLKMLVRHKSGAEIPVELTFIPFQSGDGLSVSSLLMNAPDQDAIRSTVFLSTDFANAILESLPDAVVVAEISGRLIWANPAAKQLLNLKADESALAQTLYSITLFQKDRETPCPQEDNPIARALHGEQVENQVGFVRHEKLSRGVWVNMSAAPVHDPNGKLSATVMIFHDITALHQREETARHQSLLLQEQASLLDLTRDAVFVRAAPDDVITYWNTGAQRLYGFTKEEAIGQVSHTLLRTSFPIPYEQIQSIVRQNGYWEGEVVQKGKNGQEITVHSQWVMETQDGKPQRYLETNSDITQRIQAERALQRSQEDYRLLVEASTEYAIIMLDPGGIVVSWNPGAEKVLGLSMHEAVGQPISAMFSVEEAGEEEPARELQEALAKGRSENDCWHIRRDGSRFWATGVVTPLWNRDGSLRGYVKIMRDETEQRVEEEGTQFLAHHDALTGLHNRVSFSNELHMALARADRTGTPFAVLLLDLDRFKNVNDTLGHHAGDLLLKEVALRIQSSIRETDFVARLGGDEFVIIQSDVSQHDAASTLAGKLVEELGKPYAFGNVEVVSGTSIGIAIYPKDAANNVELLKRADLAMYRAKHAGRHNYQFYTSDLMLEENWKENRAQALRKALKNHKFELYYQPQVDLDNWKITAVEALLRWHATELELVLPNEFLAVAEETGIIVEIGEWALRQACLQVRQWQMQGLSDLRISVNCSARQFSDAKFVAMIPAVLDDTGLAHSSLELEVSESMLALQPDIKNQLIELREAGVRITIDNFGTGNIALLELKDLAVDALKIDKEFVRHLPHRRQDSAITSAIISLARDLGVDVIAGGVETAEQLAYLKSHHCASAQGFIFSPPLSSEKFTELISKDGWSGLNRTLNHGALLHTKNLH